MPNFDIDSINTYKSPDKLFVKHIIKYGDANLRPNDGAICVVNIDLIGDFDLSDVDFGEYKLNECEVTIGEGDSSFSEFFDKVLISMCENERACIKLNKDVNIKEILKIDQSTGDNEDIMFKVHLKSVCRAAPVDELLADEKLEMAEHHKQKGTQIYTKNKMTFSITRFNKSLYYLDQINLKCLKSKQIERFKTLSAQCHFNLAAAYLKTKDFDAVIKHCDMGLVIEPNNMKGHFRKGQALAINHNYRDAIYSFQSALSLDNNNRTILLELEKAVRENKKEADMYKRMFLSV